MSAVGQESIEHTVQLTHKWLNDLDARPGWGDKQRSFRLLRTVLQALGSLIESFIELMSQVFMLPIFHRRTSC